MGLAASQARLLSITARMHDVEMQAQDIMQKKTALATRRDRIDEEYYNALDAKKLQVACYGDGATLNYVDATFATMCGYDKNRKGTYALTDSSTGEMVVDDDVYRAYQEFRGRDKYAFAFEMLGFETDDCCKELGEDWGTRYSSVQIGLNADGWYDEENQDGTSGTFKDKTTGETFGYMLMTDVEADVYRAHESDLSQYMDKFKEALGTSETADKSEVQKAIDSFRKALYQYSSEIFKGLETNSEFEDFGDFDKNEFNYYVRLFEGIEAAGGCVPVSEYSPDGSTDNDWLNNIVKTGKVLMNEYKDGAKSGWQTITTATCTTIKEVTDEIAVKKAEAKYQSELAKINAKDKRYDQDLNNLETERTALDKQMDSIKKVKDDNIERTFGIFS